MQEEFGEVVRQEWGRGGGGSVGLRGREGAGGGGGVVGVEEGHLGEAAGGGTERLGVDGGIGEGERVREGGDGRGNEGVSAQTHEGHDAPREHEQREADQ